MTEAEAEALHQILLKHWDDDEDEHAYTTKESMQDALAKAFELGRNAKSPEVGARDAARYRWLKAHNVDHYERSLPAIARHHLDSCGWGKWVTSVYDEPDEIDTAVDAAMSLP